MVRRLLLKIFRKLASLVGVPEVQRRLDVLEAETAQTQLRVANYEARQGAFERLIEKRTSELIVDRIRDVDLLLQTIGPHLDHVQQVLTQSMLSHTELTSNQVRSELDRRLLDVDNIIQSHVSNLTTQLAHHRRYVENLQATQEQSNRAAPRTAQTASAGAGISDALYVSLEDYFRGAHDVVRERQRQYLPSIRRSPVNEGYVLDLGCGRGEWLQLLKDEGIAAQGLDSNLACVEECRTYGLAVEQGDLLDHLRSLQPSSCSAVTMFQVLEHLPFSVLLDVLRESLRVLVPGGVFIGEVPNSENLTVAASTFWIDPTHQRPLFPGLLKFLAQETGFVRVEGQYSTPLREIPDLQDVDRTAATLLSNIHDSLYGNADFALIAWA